MFEKVIASQKGQLIISRWLVKDDGLCEGDDIVLQQQEKNKKKQKGKDKDLQI